MTSERKIEFYPCAGTQERLGFGYSEGHKNLVYDHGNELFLSYEEAINKYGEQNLKNMHPYGSICPDCCDIAVSLVRLKKRGIDIVEIIKTIKTQRG